MVPQTYSKQRARHQPAIGKEIQIVTAWSAVMVRIVAKFGRNLLSFPPAIFHIIPPFCLQEAAPFQLFGRLARGIAVVGLSSTSWDNCLATIIS